MKKQLAKSILIALVFLLIFLWAEIVKSPKSDSVGIYFFDVGQGDSALIQKGDFQILIDGGPDETVLSQLGKVLPLADRQIEIVILSHPHADHLVGVNSALEHYNVLKIYSSGVIHTTDSYLTFLETIKQKNIEMKVPEINETITPFENATLQFFWPGTIYLEKNIENLNNSSIVNRFCFFEQCVLFSGDIEIEEQEKMLAYYDQQPALQKPSWQSKVFKAPHHGSANAAGTLLYNRVRPRFTVISAGADNKYGHPHQRALDEAAAIGAEVLRTDRDGSINFIFAKEGIVRQ